MHSNIDSVLLLLKHLADDFLQVANMLSNDTVPLRFNCKPDPASCGPNLRYSSFNNSVVCTDPHNVNVCPEFWSSPSFEQIVQTWEDFSGLDPLPQVYSMLYALMLPILPERKHCKFLCLYMSVCS